MSSLADLLEEALVGPTVTSVTGRELVELTGGKLALTQSLSGMDGPPKRKDWEGDPAGFKVASTRWRTASRRAQRFAAEEGKQQRGRVKVAALTPEQRARAQAASSAAWIADFRRHGAYMRLTAWSEVGSPPKNSKIRLKEMPSGGPAVPIMRGDRGARMREVLNYREQHGIEAAAEILLDAFFDSYGWQDGNVDEDESDGGVSSLTLYPQNRDEP